MTKAEIVPTKKETRIAPWGDRKDIREIAQRIQLMAPGAKKLSENEALALAQGAIAHDLDPFNGEIWFIPGSGLMAGIKGLRKAARDQIEGNFWTEFTEIMDLDERKKLFIPDGALAYKCILHDSETIRTYGEAWKVLQENKVPIEAIPDIIGTRPYSVGVGYFEKGEKTKMKPVQVAMKRAEADALKRRFDLPFATSSGPSDVFIEGDWAELDNEQDEQPTETPADPEYEAIAQAYAIAQADPIEIDATLFWTIANLFGIDREQGSAIESELGNWADALIYIVDKFYEAKESDTPF